MNSCSGSASSERTLRPLTCLKMRVEKTGVFIFGHAMPGSAG
jgi:hypothetical protein